MEDRLRTLADALPDGAAVTLPVSLIRSWLVQSVPADPDHHADMTVADVAAMLDRSPQTVRAWIRHGDLDAYRLRGREYRVTRGALEAFLAHQRNRAAPRSSTHSSGDSRRTWDLGGAHEAADPCAPWSCASCLASSRPRAAPGPAPGACVNASPSVRGAADPSVDRDTVRRCPLQGDAIVVTSSKRARIMPAQNLKSSRISAWTYDGDT